ncbi:hypothetical protein HOI26_03750 [Candidatus Woesearchaeota archaeon]|jgi:hypothetical protein|nr:hypothetical protein [Candidatus Woesearchaeota archaeon]MBT5740189.1 hypothetical protein [Candidatus Woesearchaeota archaeon]
MTRKILLPPNYDTLEGPLVFLAGPIQGAYNWQNDAIKTIQDLAPELNIASPRKNIIKKGKFTQEMYNEQVDWETYHLKKAGEDGVILFWLAKESEHISRRAYAQTSRAELFEWKVKHERDGTNLVVGIEDGFSGAKYIQRRFPQDCPEIPICSTLEDTCLKAVNYLL